MVTIAAVSEHDGAQVGLWRESSELVGDRWGQVGRASVGWAEVVVFGAWH